MSVPYLEFRDTEDSLEPIVGRLFSLTYPTAAVLLAIRHGHRYGFDVMDATGLPDGTVYPILRRLERRGVLEGAWEDPEIARGEQRPPRRYYRLTPVGQEALPEVLEGRLGEAVHLPRQADEAAGVLRQHDVAGHRRILDRPRYP